ncbi:MAG: multicopper oxidase domain-containing protein [Paenibacillaceae bacterium]
MYSMWIGLEYTTILLVLILSSVAGNRAINLVYSDSIQGMLRKSRKLLNWSFYLTILIVLMAILIFILFLNYDPLIWQDKLFIHLPLMTGSLLFTWLSSVPRIRKLRSELARLADSSNSDDVLNTQKSASLPQLVVPFHSLTWTAFTVLYFVMLPPVPLIWLELIIPILVLFVVIIGLWVMYDRRFHLMKHREVIRRPSLIWRILGRLAAPLTVIVIASFLITLGMNNSRLPESMSMMAGSNDYGGGAVSIMEHSHNQTGHTMDTSPSKGMISVTELTGPQIGEPDQKITLIAEKKTIKLSSGKTVEAWTYNGQAPGPELRFVEGELIEVTLINKNIDEGITVHWHGLDVPNAEDGVAGATQNAVLPGQQYVYRFVAEQVGTFWYHSHQDSKEAVKKGLFGPLIVEAQEQAHTQDDSTIQDITIITHDWDDVGFAIGSNDTIDRRSVAAGTPVRLRLINIDDWVLQRYELIGSPFKVTAIDGVDLNEPSELTNTWLDLTTGGRYDITFTMPDHLVFLRVGNHKEIGLFLSPDGTGSIPKRTATTGFEPQHYGSATTTPFGLDSQFDREFMMVLDNKLAFYNGGFSFYDTINGQVFPNTPIFIVHEGDLVKTTFVNRGSVEHPMHLHGHHILVVTRNGEPVTGSPWWSDTLHIAPGETYEVAFVADNPGIWMDHCHNLQHAAAGMTMHLMYDNVTTPYSLGGETNNHPE